MRLAQKLSLQKLFSIAIVTFISCQKTPETGPYRYEIVPNAPFDLKTYTLENGLQIYLALTKDQPKIETRIVIKAGSNQEPEHARGLAHYLEHLLFNGTDSIGAFNFKKEQPLLKEIDNLYELYRKAENPDQKNRIYKRIDSLSFEASKYANQEEFTDLMVKMGISYLNAFTRADMTGYMNEIPSNQLEKWVTLEAERFRNPLFRGFHTELETVFEEMNSYMDNGYQQAKMKLHEITFPQGIVFKEPIGTIEGVKNPSLRETKNFFETYYVPNNMAIILAGDFDPDQAVRLIEEKFGPMPYKPIPKSGKSASPFLKSRTEASITTPKKESIAIGFVGVPPKSKDAYLAEFCEMLFVNGNVDLASVGVSRENSQWLNSLPYMYKDVILHYVEAEPKNVSLEDLEKNIIADINRLKTGNYPDWLLEAVANDLKNRFRALISSNNGIASLLTNAFVHEVPLEQVFSKQEKFKTVTKTDIANYANDHYNNYSIVYKEKGEKLFQKLTKPSITPLSSANENNESEFAKKINSIQTKPIQPVFVNFEETVNKIPLNSGLNINYVSNTTDEFFNLRLVFNNGENYKLLKVARRYIEFADSKMFSLQEFQNELYKIGCKFRLDVDSNETVITISGLSDNLEKAFNLVTSHLKYLLKDDKHLDAAYLKEKNTINSNKNNKFKVLQRAIGYLEYKPEFTHQHILTQEDLDTLTTDKIVHGIKQLFNCKHSIYVYASTGEKEIADIFNNTFKGNTSLKTIEEKSGDSKKIYGQNNVFLVDFKSEQLEAVFMTRLKSYDKEYTTINSLFVEYVTSLINNEIREKRGLAYFVDSDFLDVTHTAPNSFYTRIQTQTDKYKEALQINHDIIRKMPFDESLFLKTKSRLEGIWNSWRVKKRDVLTHYENSLNRGFKYDYRKEYYNKLSEISLEDFKDYYQQWIQNSYFNLIVIGDSSQINKDYLKQFGEVHILKKEVIFGE